MQEFYWMDGFQLYAKPLFLLICRSLAVDSWYSHLIAATQSSELRMIFSLWLMIAVISTRSEAKSLSESIEDDTTLAPDLVLSDNISNGIAEIVDMKVVLIGDGNLVDSDDDENIHSEVTTIVNDVIDEYEEPRTTTIESTDKLKVFQEVHKLYDLPTDNIPRITTTSPEDLLRQEQLELNEVAQNLGDEDIVDVISNFIADKDPMLQLFLSICFIHPSCYQDSPPIIQNNNENEEPLDLSKLSLLSRDLVDNLLNRRTEKARNMLIKELVSVQKQVKFLMFKYIELGVGARGVSVLATKNIIDAVKNIWLSVDSDLEYAKSSIQELFYLVDLSTKDKVLAMAEVAEVIQAVPKKVEVILEEATHEGYKEYIRHSSWDSWKRTPKDIK